jgi:hypothetical protein
VGLTPLKKGKRGGDLSLREYFIIFLEKHMLWINYFILSYQGKGVGHQVAKTTFEGDKCQVEGMQYILLALVYFGGELILERIHFLMRRRGS